MKNAMEQRLLLHNLNVSIKEEWEPLQAYKQSMEKSDDEQERAVWASTTMVGEITGCH